MDCHTERTRTASQELALARRRMKKKAQQAVTGPMSADDNNWAAWGDSNSKFRDDEMAPADITGASDQFNISILVWMLTLP